MEVALPSLLYRRIFSDFCAIEKSSSGSAIIWKINLPGVETQMYHIREDFGNWGIMPAALILSDIALYKISVIDYHPVCSSKLNLDHGSEKGVN